MHVYYSAIRASCVVEQNHSHIQYAGTCCTLMYTISYTDTVSMCVCGCCVFPYWEINWHNYTERNIIMILECTVRAYTPVDYRTWQRECYRHATTDSRLCSKRFVVHVQLY